MNTNKRLEPCPKCGKEIKLELEDVLADMLICNHCGFGLDVRNFASWTKALDYWNNLKMVDPNQILTKSKFVEIPHNSTFMVGVAMDGPDGLNMMGTGKPIFWAAVKGKIDDWAVYCGWENDVAKLERNGDKVHDVQNIRNIMNVDNEVLEMYRWK